MTNMQNINRRTFLRNSLAAGTAFIVCGTRSTKALGANDRLRIAVAGVHGQGGGHVNAWLGQKNVELAYLIDPDEQVLAQRLAYVKEKAGDRFACKGVADVREALEDKNLDAISIAAPNHWHSLMTIWAAQAGKHVYVEKPMSHDVHEGRVVVEAQKKYGVVIQHGTQSRSSAQNAGLHELIRSGKFGKLKISYGYCCKPRDTIGFKSPSAPPAHLDWNLWRGPARIDAYHANYVHYNWHWFWETGNGDLNNQGTHQLDMAYWALDKGLTNPIRAMAIGGRFLWNDQGETPNTMLGIAEYPNGQYVFFNVRNVNYDGYQRQVENEYYFEDGGRIIGGQVLSQGQRPGGEDRYPGRTCHPGRTVRQLHRGLSSRRPPNGQRQCRRCTPQLCPGPSHEQLVSPGQRRPLQCQGGPFRRQQGCLRAFHEAPRGHERGRRRSGRRKPVHRGPLADLRSSNGTAYG